LLVFENLDSLTKFVNDPDGVWKNMEELMHQHPPLIILMNLHLNDPNFSMFKEVFLKPRNQVFVETIDKGIQTPVHFVEKHIGKFI
jgi:hypothetical protein